MKNKTFKFILNGEPKEVNASNMLSAILEILKRFPDAGKLTPSQINLTQIK